MPKLDKLGRSSQKILSTDLKSSLLENSGTKCSRPRPTNGDTFKTCVLTATLGIILISTSRF